MKVKERDYILVRNLTDVTVAQNCMRDFLPSIGDVDYGMTDEENKTVVETLRLARIRLEGLINGS
jgi:hypothetical protein